MTASDTASATERVNPPAGADTARLHRVWQVPAFLFGAGVLTVAVLFQEAPPEADAPTSATEADGALALLDRGELDKAYDQAMGLLDRPDVRGRGRGAAYFVLGSYHCLKAPDTSPVKRPAQYFRAVQYLKHARTLGGGQRYSGLLDLRLGLAWLRSGEPDRAIPLLKSAAKTCPARAADVYTWLAEAYQRGTPPRPHAALSALDVARSRLKPDDARLGHVMLRRAELLCEVKRYADVPKAVARIAGPSEDRTVGQYWIARALMGQTQVKQAAQRLTALSKSNKLGPVWRRRAAYQLGRCDLLLKSYARAIETFRRLASSYPGTQESLAADLERADALYRLGKPDQAIDQYQCSLSQIGDPLRYDNPYVSLSQIRTRLERCWRTFFGAQQYGRAVKVAELYETVALEGDGILLRARSAEQWAREITRQAKSKRPDVATEHRAKARALYRQAGDDFRRLADLRQSDRSYSDYLWLSAQCLFAAGASAEAARAFRQFTDASDSDPRYPKALVDWATCLRRMGRYAEAAGRCTTCYTRFPKNQAAFQARLRRADCLTRMGRPGDAEKMLRANLEGSDLSPDAVEWRESLFMLGHLYYSTGRYEQAVARLGEAAARYPAAAQAGLARYWEAESFRRWAEEPEKDAPKLKSNRARVLLREQRDSRLESALKLYRDLVGSMGPADDAGRLDALGQANLRNSYFAVGDCLYKLGRYPEAIAAYQRAANRYQDEPDCLGAYVQMYNCYRRLGRSEQASRMVKQARWVLKRMPESVFAARPEAMTKQQWNRWLESAASM